MSLQYVKNHIQKRSKGVIPQAGTSTPTGFKYGRSELVQRPKMGFPHAGFGSNALWIKMQAVELQSQNTANRGGSIQTGMYGPIFKFIAPENINETVSHSWEAYESMQSRLAEKIKGVARISEDAKGLKSLAGKLKIDDLSKNNVGGLSETNMLGAMAKLNLGTNIPKVKVDTPLVYTASERRQWNLTFQLASYRDPLDEVVDPIRELMKYSSPSLGSSQVHIKFPWIFKITTEPEGLLVVNHSALTSVQPTWKAPYIDGYPTSVELTLTFMDLSPLFKETIQRGGIIKVGSFKDSSPDVDQHFKQLKNPGDTSKLYKDARAKVDKTISEAKNTYDRVNKSLSDKGIHL